MAGWKQRGIEVARRQNDRHAADEMETFLRQLPVSGG
jgi:hypothetical protein